MREGYVYVDSLVFPSYFAVSVAEQEKGLMHVDWPPPVMSFVYASPRVNKFWMKNTPSPLDIVFCCEGKISHICNGEPFSTSALGLDKQSDLVIEFPLGTVDSFGIKIGHRAGVIKPSENELRKILSQRY